MNLRTDENKTKTFIRFILTFDILINGKVLTIASELGLVFIDIGTFS